MVPNRATHHILQNGANLWISKRIKRICANVFARKPNTVTKALLSLVEKNQRDIPNHPLNQLNPFWKIKPLEVNISLYWKLDNILQLFLLAKMLLCSTNQPPPQPPTPLHPCYPFHRKEKPRNITNQQSAKFIICQNCNISFKSATNSSSPINKRHAQSIFFILLMNM